MSTEPGKEAPAQVAPASTVAEPAKPAEVVEDYPDPDEDDLDDLDGTATLYVTALVARTDTLQRHAR